MTYGDLFSFLLAAVYLSFPVATLGIGLSSLATHDRAWPWFLAFAAWIFTLPLVF